MSLLFPIGGVLIVIFALLGYCIGWLDFQQWAVKQGHAEYYLDEKHKRRWRWKERK